MTEPDRTAASRSIQELSTLRGRVAIVTGAAGGIGQAACHALAEQGASLCLMDVNPVCHDLARDFAASYGVQTRAYIIDLESETDILRVTAAACDDFGRVDVLINNAALVGTSALTGWAVPFANQEAGAWNRALSINLTAPFLLARELGSALSESGCGSIINVSSIYGVVGPDFSLYDGTTMANPAAYGASKAGLIQLTRYMASALAPRVRVNALTPGGIFRNQPDVFVKRYEGRTLLRRMAREEDFKGPIAFLASDLSAYITGQNIVVDGGWTAI